MSPYTRLTVVSASRRVDVVVASGDPVGAALPRLLELLDETAGTVARPLTLVSPDGEQLDVARTPMQLDLEDGSLLRLVRLDAAPPPPVVIDVTDAAADALAVRVDRWTSRSREAAGAAGIALAFVIAGLLAPWPTPLAGVLALLAGIVVLLIGATGLGLGGIRRLAACLTAAAAGLVLPLALAVQSAAVSTDHSASPTLSAAAVAIASASTVVLVGVGVARRRRGAIAGGALGGVLGTLLLILLLAGVDGAGSVAVTAAVAAFATGPLPWIALSAAGLTGLDQRVAGGAAPSRSEVLGSIDDAYAALTWSIAAVAATIAVTGIALVLENELWAGLLALAIALVAALRSRAFPLRAQAWSLWAAASAIAATAVVVHLASSDSWIGVAVAVAAAVVVSVAVLVDPRPHTRARLRGLGNALEMLCVVALLPLLLGVFGVYGELLGMFS